MERKKKKKRKKTRKKEREKKKKNKKKCATQAVRDHPGCSATQAAARPVSGFFFKKKIISLSPLMNTFRIAVVFVVLFVRIVDVAVVLFVVKVKRCKV